MKAIGPKKFNFLSSNDIVQLSQNFVTIFYKYWIIGTKESINHQIKIIKVKQLIIERYFMERIWLKNKW